MERQHELDQMTSLMENQACPALGSFSAACAAAWWEQDFTGIPIGGCMQHCTGDMLRRVFLEGMPRMTEQGQGRQNFRHATGCV